MTTIPSNIITNSETTESAAKIAVSAPLAATTDTCVADKTASPTPASPKSKEQLWYVMTHLEPKMMEQRLQEENTSRVAEGKAPFEFFIPYQFLKRRVANSAAADDASPYPRSKSVVETNNEIRSTLREFVFIRANEEELKAFTSGDWNKYVRCRLQHYKDRNGNNVTTHDVMMRKFIDTCILFRDRFEILPYAESVEQNDEVVLNTTPFRGEKARVLEVRHTRDGISLTLGINLFSGTMLLRLPNVGRHDILPLEGSTTSIADTHIVDNTQNRLLGILSRRVHRKGTEESDRQDAATLDQLYHYRHHVIENDAARRHFLALMLITAHLRHDTDGQKALAAQAEQELATINARGDNRSATDVRTFLWVALYIATGNPGYRNAAKTYVQQCDPKSEKLRSFVRLIRKRQKI